jgi:hypothetical protein
MVEELKWFIRAPSFSGRPVILDGMTLVLAARERENLADHLRGCLGFLEREIEAMVESRAHSLAEIRENEDYVESIECGIATLAALLKRVEMGD